MMKRLLPIILFLALGAPDAHAAFSAGIVWEIRSTAAANGGGCFRAGATGTDRSQQDAAHQAYTDLVIGGTTTELTSALAPFAADDVGNCIQVISGAGCTSQIVEVLSVAGVTATIDKSAGTGASTCTGNLGGGIQAPSGLPTTLMVAGNTIYIQAATYTRTVTHFAFTVPGTSAAPMKVIGYDQTRGDDTGTPAILTSATNSIDLITLNAAHYYYFSNIKCTHTAATRGDCFQTAGTDSDFTRITNSVGDGVASFANIGSLGDNWTLYRNTVLNTTSHGISWAVSERNVVLGTVCYNVGAGAGTFHCINASSGSNHTMLNNLAVLSSGDGINIGGTSTFNIIISGNGLVDNGSDGIEFSLAAVSSGQMTLTNNIAWSNGVYGFNCSALSTADCDSVVSTNTTNAYGDNGTAALNNLSAGTNDVALTGSPFDDCDATLDCELNNTAGAGAAARATGFPGSLGATGTASTIGYRDIGSAQHQDAGGSTIIVPGAPVGY